MTLQPVDYTTLRHVITLQRQQHISEYSPWSWMDLIITGSDAATSTSEPPCPIGCAHTDCSRRWSKYPQSLFPDWTPSHVEKSGISKALTSRPYKDDTKLTCVVRGIDLHSTSVDEPIKDNRNPRIQVVFEKSKEQVVFEENKDEFYSEIQGERSSDIRVRALFVENLSGPVLQMLGTKYHINPSFFSSLLNQAPSRNHETPSGQGERRSFSSTTRCNADTTIIFPFLYAMPESDSKVKTKSQLRLSSDITLVVDMLAIHIILDKSSSTILSFHPSHNNLRHRIWDACQNSRWQNLFRYPLGTRLFPLLYFWYTLYAWDEALEMLYSHISVMELEAQEHGGVALIERLHTIRLHLFNYSLVLEEFRESVNFVNNSTLYGLHWPDRDILGVSPTGKIQEYSYLLGEISRPEKRIIELRAKLENVIRMTEGQCMQTLTEATIRGNAATGLTAYLTLVTLPAAFVSGVFLGMRGSVAQYFGIVIPLIVFTIWVVGTFQTKYGLNNSRMNHWSGFGSPFLVFRKWCSMERPRR